MDAVNKIESGGENRGGDAIPRFPDRGVRKAHNIDTTCIGAVRFTRRDLNLDFNRLDPA